METTHRKVPQSELDARLQALRDTLTAQDPSWRVALVHHKVSLYYLTGTMQDGVLVITHTNSIFWVRRSVERARAESLFANIRPMQSFRTLAEHYGVFPETVYLETQYATLDWMRMLQKYLPFANAKPLGGILSALRAVKSPYEIDCMQKAGQIHAQVLETVAPSLLRVGISEAELGAELAKQMLVRGAHGIARFNQLLGEDVIGYASFGTSALMRAAFDGPGGTQGTCIAVQSIGAQTRTLAQGDLVYLDVPCGWDGCHTDKTVVYHMGKLSNDARSQTIADAYAYCYELEQTLAQKLCTGAVPSALYQDALAKLPAKWAEGFMNGAKFLGHSVGLFIDEPPVLAKGFDTPIQSNMVFAIEPKIALPDIGVVGTENTYVVTDTGAKPLSGGPIPLQEIL